jgi:hypothetical protein
VAWQGDRVFVEAGATATFYFSWPNDVWAGNQFIQIRPGVGLTDVISDLETVSRGLQYLFNAASGNHWVYVLTVRERKGHRTLGFPIGGAVP